MKTMSREIECIIRKIVRREIDKYFSVHKNLNIKNADLFTALSFQASNRIAIRQHLPEKFYYASATTAPCSNTIFHTLCQAVSLEKRLTIQYRPVGQDALKVYNWLNPLGLVFFGDIYLVATVKNYRNPLQFRLNRVQTANILNEPALHPAGFSLQGYVECGGFHQIKKKPLKG